MVVFNQVLWLFCFMVKITIIMVKSHAVTTFYGCNYRICGRIGAKVPGCTASLKTIVLAAPRLIVPRALQYFCFVLKEIGKK